MRIMHRARLLFAVLLLVAVMLVTPFHAATAYGMDRSGTATPPSAVTQATGAKGCCAPGDANMPSVACQAACSSALAVLDTPPRLATQLAYPVQFAPSPALAGRGVTLALDPYPPRRPRIA